MTRARLAALAAVLPAGVLPTGLAASSASAADCAGRASEQSGATGTWSVFAAPEFPVGPAEISAHAVDPVDPARW